MCLEFLTIRTVVVRLPGEKPICAIGENMKSIWESFQDGQINRATATADRVQAKSYESERRINQLEAEVDSLTLLSMAMWELFGKSNGLFMKDLEAKMQEIDLRDGKLDGKLDHGPIQCSHCNRTLDERRKTCVYCGTPVTAAGARVK